MSEMSGRSLGNGWITEKQVGLSPNGVGRMQSGTSEEVIMIIIIIEGTIFDTEFESNCLALTMPDVDGGFVGMDSDGMLCDYTLAMVTRTY